MILCGCFEGWGSWHDGRCGVAEEEAAAPARLPAVFFSLVMILFTYRLVSRLHGFRFVLNQLKAGNPEPAWRSTRPVLRMFTWLGDPHWRYNVSLRPVFDGRPRRFNGQQGTVWPTAACGRDVLLIYTESCLPPAEEEPILQPYAIHREDTPAGSPNLLVYRLPLAALENVPWQGTSLVGRFADGVAVLGFDAPQEGERGTAVPFTLYWRVLADHRYEQSDPPYTSVCLEDEAGHCWSEVVEFVPYPMQDWAEGDTFTQRFEIPVPPDVPPQPMVFRVRQFNSKREYVFASSERGGVPLRVGALQVTGVMTTALHWADDASLHGDLLLLDASLPHPLIHASAELPVILSWQTVRQPAADYAARFELRTGRETGLVYTETLWGGLYPTSVWAAGEQMRTWHEIPVLRDWPAGEFDLALTLLDPAGLPQGGTVTVMSRQHHFELPTPQFSLEARFGPAIRLLGYDLHPSEPTRGDQAEVTLYWQAIEPVKKDYKVFVHLYPSSETGVIVAQDDSHPANGQAPTSTWLPGEVVTDVHLISLPGEIEPGWVTVAVGLYLPETAERLLLSSNGEGQGEDRLILTEIEIR